MAIPRKEKLRIIQEVYKEWQKIYGDREDAEAKAANYKMIEQAMVRAEAQWTNKSVE